MENLANIKSLLLNEFREQVSVAIPVDHSITILFLDAFSQPGEIQNLCS